MRLSAIAAMVAALTLTACAASREELSEDGLQWGTYIVDNTPIDIYRNTIEGSRICGGWTPIIHSNNNNEEIDVTIYLSKPYGGRSDFILGLAEISKIDADRSSYKIGVQNRYESPLLGHKGMYRERLLRWASGDFSCE
ncbi:hypothetical protein P7L78_19035 [Tistrella bauzanensis]|uniref:hypothetical protein n=1 Tax=Tistrella TaxID=171436 RepID=UPI0031F6BDA3